MNSSSDQKNRFKPSGLMVVFLLSLLSLELTILGGRFLLGGDSVMTDLFMRWRLTLSMGAFSKDTKDIILLGIDPKTQLVLGRYGAGQWVSRKPFVDSLRFFHKHLKPSVIGYDIVFEDDLSSVEGSRGKRVSESPDKLKALADQIIKGSKQGGDTVPRSTLADINRLVIEQGNKTFANAYAEVQEAEFFQTLLGFYFRGGGVDPQAIKIESWSDEDIFGDDEDGDEDMGLRIPYLTDLAIPVETVHYATKRKDGRSEPSSNASLPASELLDYIMMAPLNVPRDRDGVARLVPMVLSFMYQNSVTKEKKKYFVPSFSLMAAMLHLGVEFPLEPDDIEVFMGDKIILRSSAKGEYHIPIDDDGYMYLNYKNTFNDFDAISFSRVSPSYLEYSPESIERYAESYKKIIDGRISLVGVTVTGVDVGATPLYSNIPLVFVQMTAINNILTRSFIAPLGAKDRIVLWLVMFVLVTLICQYEKSFKLGPALFLFGVFYFIMAYVFIHKSWLIMPVVQPLLYIALTSFSILTYRFFTEERAKKKIRGMFSTMVSDKVLIYLEENPRSFSLQGRNIDTTVFFSDVASFTSISETLPPEKLTDLLNRYLTPVTDCIMSYDGYVDKYVGDGIMAVWGAPNPDPEHALKACLSALEQQAIIDGMNDELEREYGAKIHVRMGLNSGIVTAGNMGSEKKFQYTVMGDVVNLSSRLEPVNKDFNTSIIIGDTTAKAVKDMLVVRMLDKIVVKGKVEIVPIYELVGKKGTVADSTMSVLALYEEALAQFHGREWKKSLQILEKTLAICNDGASLYLKNRVLEFMKNAPPDNWHGEYIRESKE